MEVTFLFDRVLRRRTALGKLHRFGLQELLESPFTELAAIARLPVSAEGRMDVEGAVVDLDLARPNPAGDPDGALVVVGLDHQNRTENLLAHDRHVRRDGGEDGRSDEETRLQPVRRSGSSGDE